MSKRKSVAAAADAVVVSWAPPSLQNLCESVLLKWRQVSAPPRHCGHWAQSYMHRAGGGGGRPARTTTVMQCTVGQFRGLGGQFLHANFTLTELDRFQTAFTSKYY